MVSVVTTITKGIQTMSPLPYLPSHTPSLVMALGEEVTALVDTRHVLDTLYYVLDTLSISYLVLNIKCSVLCSSTTTKCNRTIIVLVQYSTVQYCTVLVRGARIYRTGNFCMLCCVSCI